MSLCRMENVTKTYFMENQTVEVLRGVSLEIDHGGFIALIGPSGSGKSTLMNLLGCLDVPTSGSYNLLDKEVLGLSDDELSKLRNEHIGFVFQSFYLIPYATALENVLVPTLYSDRDQDGAVERARGLLRLLGLEPRARFKPGQLSGGEQQRVAIARALINDPELILADEPTGQLDTNTAAEIMNLLRGMHERGKTLVVVTHDMHIASYSQRIVRIRDGRLE